MGLINTMMTNRARSQEQAALREQKRAEAAQAQKLRELEAQRKMRPQIDEIYATMGDNPGAMKKAFGDLAEAYTLETGKPLDKRFAEVMADPTLGQGLYEMATEAGATIGSIMEGIPQPLLRAQARIAKAKRDQAKAAQDANIGDTPAAPATPASGFTGGLQVPQSMLDEGVRQVAVPQGVATPAAPAPGPQIDPRLKPAVDAIDAEIATLDGRRAIVIRANGNPKPLDDRLQELRKQRHDLATKPAMTRVEAGIRREEEATPENVARETGALTRGELEGRRPTLETPAQKDAREEQTRNRERVAFKGWEDVRKRADERVNMRPMVQLLAVELERVGPTGALVGPLREGIFNVAQLVGLKPKELESIQTMEAGSNFLAGQILRDYSGPDSDKDFLRAYNTNANIRKVPEANRVLVQLLLRDIQLADDKRINMNRWVGKFHSPAAVDPATGKTFDETWNDAVRAQAPLVTKEQIDEWKKGPERR